MTNEDLSAGIGRAYPRFLGNCAQGVHECRKFYLTTAIDYSNGDPHLGHALEKVGRRLHRALPSPARATTSTS